MYNFKNKATAILILWASVANAQTFTIENSEKVKFPLKKIVKQLVFSDDQFHYYSSKMTNDKRVNLGLTSVPQIGSGLGGNMLGAGIAALSMIKKAPDYNIYIQKVDRKNMTLGTSFAIEMDVVEGSKKSKNNVQNPEYFKQGNGILIFGTRPNTKEDKYQLYAKSVDLEGKELKPWALILETKVKSIEDGNSFSIERFNDNSFVIYINPSTKKENEKYVQYIVDKDFKIVSEKKAIFPVKDGKNSIYYTLFDGNIMASVCWADGKYFLRKFDFSKSDTIQDEKVFLGDDQNSLQSLVFNWQPETKSLCIAGGYRKPKTNDVLSDGIFLAKVNYEKMKFDFLEMTPFTNGYGKKSSGKIVFGSRSDDQFAYLSSQFIRTNTDGTITFVFQSYISQYNSRNGTVTYGSWGMTESRLSSTGRLSWMTYLPQKVSSGDYGDVYTFTRTRSNGDNEYIYYAREGDLKAETVKEAGEDGKGIMMYASINSKGEKTLKEMYKIKELKAIKKLDPLDLRSIDDNELNFVFYPSGSSIMVGRILVKY